ncbi:MAG: hypothetical protein LUO96_03445, partial [Methanomicrobiales archaeon]|nr:hypothetical protein [Methanomicrobiales archaeon]
MKIGIGAGADIGKVLRAAGGAGPGIDVSCYTSGEHAGDIRDPCLVISDRPEVALVRDLMEGRIDAAIRGSLPSNATLRALREAAGVDYLLRIALLSTQAGRRDGLLDEDLPVDGAREPGDELGLGDGPVHHRVPPHVPEPSAREDRDLPGKAEPGEKPSPPLHELQLLLHRPPLVHPDRGEEEPPAVPGREEGDPEEPFHPGRLPERLEGRVRGEGAPHGGIDLPVHEGLHEGLAGAFADHEGRVPGEPRMLPARVTEDLDARACPPCGR